MKEFAGSVCDQTRDVPHLRLFSAFSCSLQCVCLYLLRSLLQNRQEKTTENAENRLPFDALVGFHGTPRFRCSKKTGRLSLNDGFFF